MARVEVLTEVSGRDPETLLTEHVPSELLANEHYADQLVERMGWALVDAEQRERVTRPDDRGSAAVAPARSVRRSTARRASKRRATARNRRGDTEASIIDFVAQHPGSTAGDLAKGLNLKPESVSVRLAQLAKEGEMKKTSRGYSTKQVSRAPGQQRARRSR